MARRPASNEIPATAIATTVIQIAVARTRRVGIVTGIVVLTAAHLVRHADMPIVVLTVLRLARTAVLTADLPVHRAAMWIVGPIAVQIGLSVM